MKYIRIIRHAKSADGTVSQSDHDRTLAPRGERDGEAMRAWLIPQPHPIEWIWTSTAVRARATADYIAAASHARVVPDHSLYLANPEAIIDIIRSTPPDVESMAVVAHNPGLTQLVNLLGTEPVTDNLVTLGLALFGFENDWSQLVPGYGHFISLQTPKSIS